MSNSRAVRSSFQFSAIALTLMAVTTASVAAKDIAGHWVGAITIQSTELKIDIDFKKEADAWVGDISIPQQGANDLALGEIALADANVSFVLLKIPGNPTFKGKLSDDGAKITGDFTQGPATGAFALERADKAAGDTLAALDGFDAFIDQAIKDWNVPGLAIGIVKDGETIYAKGFGKRDLEDNLPVTPDTLFAIGSCTKAFTAFAVGTLVDEAKLDWDKPVVDYLPHFKLHDEYATEHITPRDLLTHRSGLPRHDLAWYNNNSLSRKQMVERLRYYEPNKELRETFQYNNMMFLTAGYMVGELTGSTWEDAVRKRIFEPLGMNASNFSVEASQKKDDFATPYEEKDDKIRLAKFRNIDNVGPAGSINSNVTDMTKWIALHLGDGTYKGRKVINKSTLNALHTPQIAIAALPDPDEPEMSPRSYALGWFTQTYRGHYRVEHGGAIDGFIAAVSLFPNDNLGIVVLANKTGTALPELVVRHAADRLLKLESKDWNHKALTRWIAAKGEQKKGEEKKDTFRRQGTKPARTLEEYAGDYEHPGYGLIHVDANGEKLVVTFNSIVTPFEHWHYEVFSGLYSPDDHTFENLRIQFLGNLKGDIDRVAVPLEPATDEIIFKKKPDSKLSDPVYLAKFTGTYQLAEVDVTVAVKGNQLTLLVPGQPLYDLVPDRNDEFNIKGIGGYSVRFMPDSAGSMMAVLNQPNGVFELKRKGQ